MRPQLELFQCAHTHTCSPCPIFLISTVNSTAVGVQVSLHMVTESPSDETQEWTGLCGFSAFVSQGTSIVTSLASASAYQCTVLSACILASIWSCLSITLVAVAILPRVMWNLTVVLSCISCRANGHFYLLTGHLSFLF